MKGALSFALGMAAIEILAMGGAFAFPALMPLFFAEWGLSKTEAGWISGIYFLGYAASVIVLTSLTDRTDARRIFVFGLGVSAISSLGFGWLAQGFWSALILRAIAGVGLAGVYMPGLRALLDRVSQENQARASGLYVSSFSLGTALSFLASGWLAEAFGWRWAFLCAAIGAGLAIPLTLQVLKPLPRITTPLAGRLLDFRPVFKNRKAMGFVAAYALHVWELFAYRSWMVAFLAYVIAQTGEANPIFAPATVAGLSGLAAWMASLLGNEATIRFGRLRVLIGAMIASAVFAPFAAIIGHMGYGAAVAGVLIYAALIQLDSSALTAAAAQAAEPMRRGATLALHSLMGFTFGFLGPLAVGAVLDATGGGESQMSWIAGFAVMGLAGLLGPPLLLRFAR